MALIHRLFAQCGRQRVRQKERHARPTEILASGAGGHARIHQRIGFGQRARAVRIYRRRQMMVGDDDCDPLLLELPYFVNRGDAVVDRDHEGDIGMFRVKPLQRSRRHAIAFAHPFGDERVGHGAEAAKHGHENGGRAHAIGVVVAKDDDLATVAHEGHDDADGGGNSRKGIGRLQLPQRREKEGIQPGGVDAAHGQQARQHGRQSGSRQFRSEGRVIRAFAPTGPFAHRNQNPSLSRVPSAHLTSASATSVSPT